MNFSRHFRRITAALACMAILLAALAPAISHALSDAGQPRSLWAEICSSTGLKQVKLESATTSSVHGEPVSAFEHCPFCQCHGGMPALPPAALDVPAYSGSFPLPILFYQAPRPLFAWAGAQSRAPPFHS